MSIYVDEDALAFIAERTEWPLELVRQACEALCVFDVLIGVLPEGSDEFPGVRFDELREQHADLITLGLSWPSQALFLVRHAGLSTKKAVEFLIAESTYARSTGSSLLDIDEWAEEWLEMQGARP